MYKLKLCALLAFATMATGQSAVDAHWSVRVGIGLPIYPYGYGPYYRPYYGYYGPPVVVGAIPAPTFVVQPAPVVVQQQPSTSLQVPQSPEPLAAPQPAPAVPAPIQPSVPGPLSPAVARNAAPDDRAEYPQLRDPSEIVRHDAVLQLGRSRTRAAIGALAQTLGTDPSARVREASARALGLIADPASLQSLQTAALADDDREVRHSAQFAAEVIRGAMPRR